MKISRIVFYTTALLIMAIIGRPTAASKVDAPRAFQAAISDRRLAKHSGIGGEAVICDNIGARMNFCIANACVDRACATATTILKIDLKGTLDCGDLEAEFCSIYDDTCCPECSLIKSVYVHCVVVSSIEHECPGTDCGDFTDMTSIETVGNDGEGSNAGLTRSSGSTDTAAEGASNISGGDFGSNDLSCDHELSGCLMEHCLDEMTTCLDPYPIFGAANFGPESCDDSQWQYCDMAHQAISSVDQCCPQCVEVTREYFSCLLENTVLLNSSFCSVTVCEEWSGGKSGGASVFVAVGLLVVLFSTNGGVKSGRSAIGIVLLVLGASVGLVSGAMLI